MNSIDINIQNNTLSDQQIADIISTGVSLTGEEGLTGAASQLQTLSLQLVDTGFKMADEEIDKYIDQLFELINQFLSDNGIIPVIEDCVDVANSTVNLAKKGLNIVSTGANVTANIIQMSQNICSICDGNVTYIPAAKGPVSAAAASLKNMIIAQYFVVKQQLLDLKNSLICTSQDAVIDNVIASVNAILDFIEPMVDPYLAKYTGYTISEVKFLCNTGFMFINMITRGVMIAKMNKLKHEDDEDDENDDSNLTDEQKKKKESAKKSRKEFNDKCKKDLSKEQAKANFMEWLQQQNFILQNAFMIVMIKDLIDDIKVQCLKLQNSGIESLADFLNTCDMVFKIFELMGYEPGKQGLTVDNIIELASVVSATAIDTTVNAVNQIENNAKNAINQNVAEGRNAQTTLTNTASDTVNEGASAASDTIENEISNEYNGDVFTISFEQSESDGKTINANLILYANPDINADLYNRLKEEKSLSGKQIFNNAKIKSIKDNVQDAWDDEEDISFEISVKVDKVTKKYVFNVTIDADKYKKWLNDQNDANNEKAEQLEEEAKQKAIQQGEKSLTALKNAISQLASVNIKIDMALINDYFKDKVLMFDFIVKMLDSLWPVYDILKFLAHLVENYKINKKFVMDKERVSIAEASKKISQIYDKLGDIITLEDTNFFPVRTDATASWIYDNFGKSTSKDGTLTVDIVGTAVLKDYCVKMGIIPECELSLLKGTTFYFDIDKDNYYADGGLQGLDNVKYNEELQEVYYDSRHRSTIASQILRAKGKNEDPYLKEVKTPDTSIFDMDQMLKNITVATDEFEGQQVINLNDMYCCPTPDLLDVNEDNKETKYYTIVEFGDEYTGGDAVDFSWNVRPGDSITDSTIIAYIHKKEKDIPVKSIYSKGYVRENSDHSYWHLYPDSCNRHICICDTSLGVPSTFDYKDVQQLTDNMSESGILFNMMMNNMIPSLLPVMLSNAYRNGDISNGIIYKTSNVNTVFSSDNHNYNEIISEYAEEISQLSSNDNIKGNLNNLESLGNQIISIRNDKIYNYIKSTYNDMCSKKLNGDTLYLDCEGLAYDTTYYQYQNDFSDEYNIGSEKYNNYYIQLLSKIDISGNDKYIKKYHKLINDIINYRINKEVIDVEELKKQFNLLYRSNIGYSANPYNMICNNIKDYTFDNVQKYIKNKKLQTIASSGYIAAQEYTDGQTYYDKYNELKSDNSSEEEYNNFYKKLENTVYTYSDSSYSYDNNTFNAPINQLTNMFILIKTAKIDNNRTKGYLHVSDNENKSISNVQSSFLNSYQQMIDKRDWYKKLIEKEAIQIKNFWNEMIRLYENELSYASTLKALTDYTENLGQYSDWPIGYDMKIENDMYKLYTFMNKEDVTQTIPDLAADIPDLNIPDPEIDYTQIADINGPGNITILDYEYWLVYMANATLFTLIPTYWADGFDVPPNMTPTKLPAIYFPIMAPINIPIINVTMVIGLAIRGIWVFPIVLLINQNSNPIDIIFPAIVALQQTREIFKQTMCTLENAVPSLIDEMINKLANENADFKKDLDKFRTYASILRSIPIEDKALIEEEFMAAVYDAEEKTADKKAARKAAREKKKRDKRQVITREEDLGEGQDPM